MFVMLELNEEIVLVVVLVDDLRSNGEADFFLDCALNASCFLDLFMVLLLVIGGENECRGV
jgi:hypothetical protein